MLETTPSPALPRQRQASAGAWDGPGSGFVPTRYDTSGRDGAGVRVTGVVLVAIVLLAAAIVVVPGTVGPGLGIAAVGVGTALVLAGLNSPKVALVLLIMTLFFRDGIKVHGLPAEPYLFAFAGVLGAAGVALSRQQSRMPHYGPVEGFMAVFVLWCIGSAVLPHEYAEGAENPAHNFILLGVAIPFVLYIVGRTMVDTERILRVVIWAYIGVWAYSVLHSILQFHARRLAWPDTFSALKKSASWADRALGVFGSPVENGFVLVVGFMLAVYIARSSITGRLPRSVLYVFCVLCLYSIYLTRTRIVYLIFVLALIVGALAVPRIRAICLTLLGCGSVAALAFINVLLSSDRNAGGLASSYEVQDRLNMIATAFWAIKQKPLLGWGIARFAKVNTYHHQQWSQDVPWQRGYGIIAHVNELGIATELGVIGLVLWVTVLGLVAVALGRAVRTAKTGGQQLAGRELVILLASFAALWVITGYTVDLRYMPFGNMTAWLFAGIAVGIASHMQAEPPAQLEEHHSLDEDEALYLRWVAASQ